MPIDGPPDPEPGAGGGRGRRVARASLVLAVVGAAVYVFWDRWSEVHSALGRLSAGAIVPAVVAGAIGTAASFLAWRALLADLGSPLPLRPAARIFFLGQLGKYLPGSVWPVVAQMELGRDHDVPRPRSAAAIVLAMAISLTGGLLVAAILLPLTPGVATGASRWALLAIIPLAVLLHPAVLNRLLRTAARLLRRSAPEHAVSAGGEARALAWTGLQWLGQGLAVWLLAVDLGAPRGKTLLLAVGGFAIAWAVGFLVVIAPAGAGVREAALVTALAPVLSAGSALVVALVVRLLLTVVDLAGAGTAVLAERRRRTRPRRGASQGCAP